MQFAVLLLVLLIPIAFISLVICSRTSAVSQARLYSALATIAAAPLLGFCVFGFLASFEISSGLPFRIGYAAIAMLVLSGITAAWWPRQESPDRSRPRTALASKYVGLGFPRTDSHVSQ